MAVPPAGAQGSGGRAPGVIPMRPRLDSGAGKRRGSMPAAERQPRYYRDVFDLCNRMNALLVLESCADTHAAEAPASSATPKPDSHSPEQTGTARTLSILLFAPDIEVLHLNDGIAVRGLVKTSRVLACHRPTMVTLVPGGNEAGSPAARSRARNRPWDSVRRSTGGSSPFTGS